MPCRRRNDCGAAGAVDASRQVLRAAGRRQKVAQSTPVSATSPCRVRAPARTRCARADHRPRRLLRKIPPDRIPHGRCSGALRRVHRRCRARLSGARHRPAGARAQGGHRHRRPQHRPPARADAAPLLYALWSLAPRSPISSRTTSRATSSPTTATIGRTSQSHIAIVADVIAPSGPPHDRAQSRLGTAARGRAVRPRALPGITASRACRTPGQAETPAPPAPAAGRRRGAIPGAGVRAARAAHANRAR